MDQQPKRRGRPPQPDARSVATRKRTQRERDAEMIAEKLVEDLPERCLLQILSTKRYRGLQPFAWEELGRRKGFIV